MDTLNKTIIRSELPPEPVSVTGLPFRSFAIELRSHKFRVGSVSPGDRIGKYEVCEHIGSGGFSSIHRARHIYLNHQVAIKTLKTGTELGTELFLREAQALALMDHPNVVRVYDADIVNGVPFIAMELLIGMDLRSVLKKFERFSIGRTMDLMEELLGVLKKQEEKGVLHLDIKPANIFQRVDGSFSIFDYGLVGVTSPAKGLPLGELHPEPQTFFGQAFGTPAYMPPEQAGGKADHRSDLYSLGLTIWECLVGRQARQMSRFSDVGQLVSTTIPPPKTIRSDLPIELDSVVCHLISTSPNDRYQAANDVLDDLFAFRYQGRRPIGATVGTALIAIPFSTAFTETFSSIRTACEGVKLKARRLDQHVFLQDIWNQCLQEMEIAKVVIADFSGDTSHLVPNPNVVTEAAHARAVGKPLVLITQGKPEDMPFDWRHMPVVTYEKSECGLQQLVDVLTARLRHVLQGWANQ